MQTFLPYADFKQSASVLDSRRCWKQCLEARAILEGKWVNHPASKMWIGYHDCLKLYLITFCIEWEVNRNGKNPIDYKKIENELIQLYDSPEDIKAPPWMGNEDFHKSHKSKLLFKGEKAEWYYFIKEKYKGTIDVDHTGKISTLKGKHLVDHICKTLLKIPKWDAWTADHFKKLEDFYGFSYHNNHFYSQYNWDVPNNLPYKWPTV